MNDQTLQKLVGAYCKEQTQGLRHAIVSEAMPLLKSIIGKIPRPYHALARYEDLESAGIVGLLQALDKYDGSRDVKFSTFAYYRIRGNIVDYMRSIDELPRAQRTNYGKAQGVMQQLGQALGREAKDAEVAEALEMPLDKYQRLLSSAQKRAVLSIDKPAYGENSDGCSWLLKNSRSATG